MHPNFRDLKMENVVTLETVTYDVSPLQDLSEPLLPPGAGWTFKAVLELQTFSHVGLTTELPLFVFQLHMGLMFTEPTLKKTLSEWMNELLCASVNCPWICLTPEFLQNVSSSWEHEVVMFDVIVWGCSVLTVGGKILFLPLEVRGRIMQSLP